jgi:hypothetical protein
VAAVAVSVIAVPAASADVVKYDTTLTLTQDRDGNYHGRVKSDRDRSPAYHPANAVRKCMEGRRVILFELQPGADRKIGTARSRFIPHFGQATWRVDGVNGDHVRAKVERKVTREEHHRFVCRADRSPTI